MSIAPADYIIPNASTRVYAWALAKRFTRPLPHIFLLRPSSMPINVLETHRLDLWMAFNSLDDFTILGEKHTGYVLLL